ncbi:MAG: hypothetical protein WBQ76_16090 [Candidatus Korobacteraceae bacterium]
MPGDSTSGKRVAIAVAVIGAIATLGAAFLSSLHKPKEQTPSIQQTASGSGSVNVGRDAVITNNIKSAAEEAAERVQACEERHGMKAASEKTQSSETIPATNYDPESVIKHIGFRSCVWPKSRYSDEDGYLEIKVRTVDGPGEYEATGTTDADRITAPCRQLMVAYQLGTQAYYENAPPITITANTVVTDDGKPWTKEENGRPLSFYPDAGEFVVLHNDKYGLQSAKCAD